MTAAPDRHKRFAVIASIGVGQILAWGSSYYLLAVLAGPVVRATGWSETWVIVALSLGLLTSGVVSPAVGRRIEQFGGRPVLAASAILLAIGLLIQAVAPNLAVFITAWLVIGVGMGAGLYDPAFSTLGRLYGEHARSAITHLTLFGGFASTVCWPLSALFVEHLGWRGTSAAYAAINLLVVLPLYLLGVPREEQRLPPEKPADAPDQPTLWQRAGDRSAFITLAIGLTVASVIMTVISVHVLTLLQARGLTLAAAVSLGALIGPSQVGARVLEAAFGRRHHPIWSLLVIHHGRRDRSGHAPWTGQHRWRWVDLVGSRQRHSLDRARHRATRVVRPGWLCRADGTAGRTDTRVAAASRCRWACCS